MRPGEEFQGGLASQFYEACTVKLRVRSQRSVGMGHLEEELRGGMKGIGWVAVEGGTWAGDQEEDKLWELREGSGAEARTRAEVGKGGSQAEK